MLDDAICVLLEKLDFRPFTWQLLAAIVNGADKSIARSMVAPANEEFRKVIADIASETTHDARMEKHAFIKRFVKGHLSVLRGAYGVEVMQSIENWAKNGPYLLNGGGGGEKAAVGTML